MFYLVTGTPGAGKTLFTIQRIANIKDRPVYYHDINLSDSGKDKLGWSFISQVDIIKWRELPPNSLVVIDEAHKLFPVRSSSQKPPEWIEALAEHRHLGLDFYFITQHPMDLDVFIRRRIFKHFHYKRQFGYESATLFEWEGLGEPDDKWSCKNASKTRLSYPKDFYNYYHSAVTHTVKKVIPKQLYFAIFGIILFISFLAFAVSVLLPDSPSPVSTVDPAAGGGGVGAAVTANLPTLPAVPPKTFSRGLPLPDWLVTAKSIYFDGVYDVFGQAGSSYLVELEGGDFIPIDNKFIQGVGGLIAVIEPKCTHRLLFDQFSFFTKCKPVELKDNLDKGKSDSNSDLEEVASSAGFSNPFESKPVDNNPSK